MTDPAARVRDAQALLDNPLFQEALAALETKAVDAWLNSRDDQVAERDRLWIWAMQARRLKAHLQAVIDNAKFDAAKAERTRS